MSKPEIYISVDIEAAGPIPGEYSMLSLGACLVDRPEVTFQRQLQPISEKFIPEALAVSGITLQEAARGGTPPARAMRDFAQWVEQNTVQAIPVFVGFNATFDWSFVNWYFHRFLGSNPFGIGGLDIKAFFMGYSGCRWQQTTSRQIPAEFHPPKPLTHDSLQDAIAQAEIFRRLLTARRASRSK